MGEIQDNKVVPSSSGSYGDDEDALPPSRTDNLTEEEHAVGGPGNRTAALMG